MMPPRPERRPQSAAGVTLSRRALLGRLGAGAGALALAPALGGIASLSACGGSDTKGTVTQSNWITYLDDQSKALFEKQTGLKLRYVEDINDNNEFFAKIQPKLSAGKSIDRDLITPTFWMAARLIALDWVQPLPLDQVPNAANLVAELRNPVWDPDGRSTLPWQTGMTGIAYNRKITGRELRVFDDLLDPAFKGRIAMLKEMRDTLGLAMLSLGKDPSKATFDLANGAFEKLEKAKAAGQIRQFTGNDYVDDLVAGNFAACVGWSGDIAQLVVENPDLRFVVPEEGGMRWADVMLMPKGAAHPENAAKWMNFVYDPVNAARITAEIQYISPVRGVREVLAAAGGEQAALADNPLVFPDAATLGRLRQFGRLSEDEAARFDERFAKLVGS